MTDDRYLADTSDWCHRCVGLIAIAQIAEGCNQQLVDRLDSIVHIVVQHLGTWMTVDDG